MTETINLCPKCNEREVAEGRYVYIRRGNYYPKEPRCEICYECAVSESIDRAIKASRNWENYCGPDVWSVGKTTYYKTTSGVRSVSKEDHGREI